MPDFPLRSYVATKTPWNYLFTHLKRFCRDSFYFYSENNYKHRVLLIKTFFIGNFIL